jgi:molecular chaperone HscB
MSPLKVLNPDATAVPVVCWSCAVAQNESTLFCATCSKVQPPPGVDYFQVFSLPRRLQIDLAALEHEFHQLSRKLHPDRFARATEAEREFSLADTALVNDAYRTLRDPVRRTEYLLKLEGEEIGEEHAGKNSEGKKDTSRVPADLLEEVFELNMQLDELREGDANDPALLGEIRIAGEKFTAMLNELDMNLEKQWMLWDEGDATARTTAQKQMVTLLDRRRYLDNLLRDVKKVLGA